MMASKPAVLLGFVIAVAAMLWPAFYNGQAFFFPDTTAYVRGADAAGQKLTGVTTAWSRPTPSSVSSVSDKTVLAGRSIYYGVLLYAGDRAGGEWLSILVQASLLILALLVVLNLFELGRWPFAAVLIGVLVIFTVAPLYASFLMPDVFTGLTILACSILLTCDLRGRYTAGLFWFVLLAAALTFHTTHAILALIMFVAGVALYLWRRPYVMLRGLGAIGAALVFAYICGAAFTFGVTKLVGEPPLTPPFLMARLIDDGPGFRYLKDTCPQNGLVVCQFLDRLPMQSDDFLWAQGPGRGVFAASSPTVRRALSREQYRFAIAAIAHEPWGQFKVSARNAVQQMALLGATEFSYTADDKATFAEKVPSAYFDVMQKSRAYTGTMPIGVLSALSYVSTIAGLLGIAYVFLMRRRAVATEPQPILQVTALVVFGVFANAAICGVMSGPHDRYEARVAWLIPAMALIAHFRLYRGWWSKTLGLKAPRATPPDLSIRNAVPGSTDRL